MKIFTRWLIVISAVFLHYPAMATVTEYTLVIDREPVNITGKIVERITVNGSIPGPIMEFTEGDEAIIHVVNNLDEPTSVHWHGLLLPPEMDGVPGLGGYEAIKAGETFTYRFPHRQNDNYWHHAHSALQEQNGHYGALMIYFKDEPVVQADRDYVVLLSDFSNETMMAHPIHLHGMFVQLENGQPGEKLPNKHTVNVAPGTEYSVLLTADEPGEWAFHCHLLYHMSAGMMSTVVVAEYDEDDLPTAQPAPHDMGGHHDHH
ncbi:multicopper oxidase domain-containing protein [Methylophaga nitratireducenticrescens]|uniref:multicopper oxidase domain-containing protein n=1 Tax=Methylophaga nitratireducenticrescens TaxID=754476 RepID=UPI000CDC4264|nr:multicopper oxidase domain-containing protein [Methylophaga nitratireducenticrescens]AUZ85285.1 hypothetical protein CDW43_12225 [Methylophaga nitratireducenticrescens]